MKRKKDNKEVKSGTPAKQERAIGKFFKNVGSAVNYFFTGEEPGVEERITNQLKRNESFFKAFFDNNSFDTGFNNTFFKENTEGLFACIKKWINLSSYELTSVAVNDALRAYSGSDKVRDDMAGFKKYVDSIEPESDPVIAAEKGYHNYLYYLESDINSFYKKAGTVKRIEKPYVSMNSGFICNFIERYCSESEFDFINNIPSSYKLHKSIINSIREDANIRRKPDDDFENDLMAVSRTVDSYINANGSKALSLLFAKFDKSLTIYKSKRNKLRIISDTIRKYFPPELFSKYNPEHRGYINNGDTETVIHNFREITALIDKVESEIGGWDGQ